MIAANSKKLLKHELGIKCKLEARKQLRAERANIWKTLLNLKPDETYEDPKDIAAIRYATLHMGDYKLKSASNYIVPESDRVDADKKKRQIVLLRESINMLKEVYFTVLKMIITKFYNSTLIKKF